MSTPLMPHEEDRVVLRFDPRFGQRVQFSREPRVAERLVDVPFLTAMTEDIRVKNFKITPEI